ncbi:MAG: TipAS antibiotic-recognition domain-containing protein [Candidatus Eremiobacteraeota bacterium]|nr:TipAS antibiotic-recognition domain-containing protein [Candidatus Eremiobacteraeota bacterium]MBC5802371.1 TipAS antibiotic-recognition domain-containing protein [Candidatus Eremiobacteraeota bacterium]MBC5820589.1 TipAS antibiotic-recognition domain-containing protein [Candidatus Eremiobacteraeota bacterium]
MDDFDFTKHYTREQLDGLGARNFGPEEEAEVLARWECLFADIEASLDEDPASVRAQTLLERWDALVADFTKRDPGLERPLDNLYRDPNCLAKVTEAMPRLPRVYSFMIRARAARAR